MVFLFDNMVKTSAKKTYMLSILRMHFTEIKTILAIAQALQNTI